MNSDQGNRRLAPSVGPFLTLGLQLAITVVVLFFLGKWLDSRWGTSPWLMLVGLFLGIVGGLFKFVRTAMDMGKEEDANDKPVPPHP